KSVELWVGCVAGALSDSDYIAKLTKAGFESATIEVTRVYNVEDAGEFLAAQVTDIDAIAREVDGKFVSGFVRATKPRLARSTGERSAEEKAAESAACASSCCGRS